MFQQWMCLQDWQTHFDLQVHQQRTWQTIQSLKRLRGVMWWLWCVTTVVAWDDDVMMMMNVFPRKYNNNSNSNTIHQPRGHCFCDTSRYPRGLHITKDYLTPSSSQSTLADEGEDICGQVDGDLLVGDVTSHQQILIRLLILHICQGADLTWAQKCIYT